MDNPTNTTGSATNEVIPKSELTKTIEKATGINAMDCYQCGKCSSGCPIVEVTDLLPHDLWKMVQLGMEEQVLNSNHMWLCIGCETCTSRCPNQLPLPKVIDYFREKALKNNMEPTEPGVVAFHKAFMNTIKSKGRLSEVGLVQKYSMATGEYFKDLKLGLSLFTKGKIKLFAKGVSAKKEIKDLFERGEK